MKRKVVVISIAVLIAVGSAGAMSITETQFDVVAGQFTEANASVTDQDTLQQTHPDHLLVESMVWSGGWVPTDGPGWGGWTVQNAMKDAGSDWWAYNGFSTIGVDGIGDGYLDYRWKDDYQYHPAFDGWDLDSISILVGIADGAIDRVNYKFRIEVLSHDWLSWTTLDMDQGTPGQQDWLIGGSDTIGVGTKIEINDIGIQDIRGFRITANAGWTAAYNNDGTANPNQIWAATQIAEIDVNLVPEPATIGILGLGGLLLRKRKNR